MKNDDFTRLLVRFMNARVAGRGAEAFVCCEATGYPRTYGDVEHGRPDGYVVDSRKDRSRTEVVFMVHFVGSYRGDPEKITVRRTRYGDVKVAEIH